MDNGDQLIKDGAEARRRSDYREAERLLKEALRQAEEFGPEDARPARFGVRELAPALVFHP